MGFQRIDRLFTLEAVKWQRGHIYGSMIRLNLTFI
jgi:hypothetical protein